MSNEQIDFAVPLILEASAGRVPTFSMDAYTGGIMRPAINGEPVLAVVDLATLKIKSPRIALLRDHDSSRPVGHTESIVNDGQTLKAAGLVSQNNKDTADVLAAAKNKYPWQASISVDILQSHRVPTGQSVAVNGRTLTGPFILVTQSELREISVVALGGDTNASLHIAAKAAGGIQMDPVSPTTPAPAGADPAAATPSPSLNPHTALNPVAPATNQVPAQTPTPATFANNPHAATVPATAPATLTAASGDLAAFREQRAAEMERMARISDVCGPQHAVLAAQAIREGWTAEKTELSVLRASRPSAPSVHAHGGADATPDVLTAGFCMAGNLPNLDKQFSAQTLDAADKAFKGGRNVSLQRMLLTAAQANGYHGTHLDKSFGGMRDLLTAAFSTRTNVVGIFSNTANKFLLDGYNFVEQKWREIATVRNVADFKAVTSYRLTDSMNYEPLGPAGEIKHGTLGEQSYTNKAQTYAKMLAITREDIINDDLGALTTIPTRLGRGAALNLNKIFWKAWQNDATLFSDSNVPDNLATSALSIAGLTTVKTQFDSFADDQGEILGAEAAILLVPSALELVAMQLMNTTMLVGGSTPVLASNVFANKYRVVTSKYLNNAPTTWYLLADPRDIPMIEVAFLNGVQTPTVETADVDFNTLGIQMRGYMDFGVGLQDPRGGIKSVG